MAPSNPHAGSHSMPHWAQSSLSKEQNSHKPLGTPQPLPLPGARQACYRAQENGHILLVYLIVLFPVSKINNKFLYT